MAMNYCFWRSCRLSATAGFTLTEGLIVVVIVGLLMAIAAPSLFGWWQQRKINATQDLIYQALRETQADAMQHRHDRRFSLRQQDGYLEWASHSDAVPAGQVTVWDPLPEGVLLDDDDTTLLTSGGIHYVKFDLHGNVTARLGTVTLAMGGGKRTHRCVVVSTMIGAMRKGTAHAVANDNSRFCY